jgi:hypothetical protein
MILSFVQRGVLLLRMQAKLLFSVGAVRDAHSAIVVNRARYDTRSVSGRLLSQRLVVMACSMRVGFRASRLFVPSTAAAALSSMAANRRTSRDLSSLLNDDDDAPSHAAAAAPVTVTESDLEQLVEVDVLVRVAIIFACV